LITLAAGYSQAYGIAVDVDNVYFTTNVGATGVVVKVPVGGGPTTVLASAQNFPHQALHSNSISCPLIRRSNSWASDAIS